MSDTGRAAAGCTVVQMRNIWKRFPGVAANQRIDLDLRAGEVHALLGENGAGKTTLMNILSGLYRPDAGEIWIDGRLADLSSPADAIRHGVGMVHQHFRLVDTLTVAENIYLGWQQAPRLVSPAGLAKRVAATARELGYEVEPGALIVQLSVGEQQRVEILKALTRGVRVLILDEPTAVLTPSETAELLKALRVMASKGHTVVFISHKLSEVLAVSDRITVLRNGQRVATNPAAECDHRLLARLMMGQDVELQDYNRQGTPGSGILDLQGVSAVSDRGLPALREVDLVVRRGEILGIAGVSGNGQRELAEVITGLRPVTGGRILLDGIDCTGKPPAQLCAAGVGHIPESRLGTGLFPSLSVLHNAILREYRRPPLRRGVRLVGEAAVELASDLVQQADVRVPHLGVAVQNLSGGNQQKLLTKREMRIASRVLVAMHPTRGLDVVATEDLRQALVAHRNNKVAVLLVSEDLDEILMLSDRVAVMCDGRVMGLFDSAQANRENVGLLMGGGTLEKELRA
jgi:ABC-type uncharacterized transport system ATPase subunit